MVKTSEQFSANLSVFPFLKKYQNSRYAGLSIALFYFALMVFVGLKYHIVGNYDVETDFFQVYVPVAKSMVKGIWEIDDFRGPGYPVILGIVNILFGDYFKSGIIISAFAASAVLFFIFEIIKKLFRFDIAVAVTLLTAVNRTFVLYSYTAGTDMMFNAFAFAALYFLLKENTRSRISLLPAAFFSAGAYLTRYNGIFIILAVPFLFIIMERHSAPLKQRLIHTAIFTAAFFLFISPWGFYLLAERGSFFYNKNYLNIAYEMFGKGKVLWDQFWNVEASNYSSLFQVFQSSPKLFLTTLFHNLYEHLSNDLDQLLGWWIGIFFIAGFAGMWIHTPDKKQKDFYLFGILFYLVLLLVFYNERFSMFLIPFYCTVSVTALTWNIWKKISLYFPFLVLLFLAEWTAVKSYSYNALDVANGPIEILNIAENFNQYDNDGNESEIVVCRKPHIAYYINKTMKYFPYVDTWEELKADLKKSNASYLYFGEYEAQMRPQFKELLNPQNAPEWLDPISYTVIPPSVLYKVNL